LTGKDVIADARISIAQQTAAEKMGTTRTETSYEESKFVE